MSETAVPQRKISKEEKIAEVCHEANLAYCRTIGDRSQVSWYDAPEWQRESMIEGVTKRLSGEITSPEQSHESWMAHKIANGWTYGPVKDALSIPKRHPCIMPYEDLPLFQRQKDILFAAIVGSF